jgi:hypothetical protein
VAEGAIGGLGDGCADAAVVNANSSVATRIATSATSAEWRRIPVDPLAMARMVGRIGIDILSVVAAPDPAAQPEPYTAAPSTRRYDRRGWRRTDAEAARCHDAAL